MDANRDIFLSSDVTRSSPVLYTLNRVEPLFRGHPREEGKCPLNGGWAGDC